MPEPQLLLRADAAQQRRAWLAFPYAVYQKASDDQAGSLAALLAYYAFFSVFPLALVLLTVLAYIAGDNPALRHKIFHDVLGPIPILAQSDQTLHPLQGNLFALVSGSVLALWNGLAVANAAQQAFNTVYAVPYHEWPGLIPSTLRSLVTIVGGGIGFGLTTAVTGAITGSDVLGLPDLGAVLSILGGVLAVALNTGLFTLVFRFLVDAHVSWRDVLPGACFTAVGWYGVQLGGTALFSHYVAGATNTYGTFATVIGLLTIFALLAQITLYGSEINVVRSSRLWPRGLGSLSGSPTTDADQRAYTLYAVRQRFAAPDREQIEVRFTSEDTEQPVGRREASRSSVVDTRSLREG